MRPTRFPAFPSFPAAAATAAATLALLPAFAAAEVVGQSFPYEVDGMAFEGYVAADPARESLGTVLIVHDWDGLTAYEIARADMLAALGYTAFAIDVYGADADPQGMDDYRALSGALYGDRATFRERLLGSVAEAANIPGAGGEIVMIGYCFGGAAVLEAARAGADLSGFVAFHAGLGTPEGQDWSMVKAPIRFHHGTADPVAGMADLAKTLDELEAAGVAHAASIYGGARHSFTVFGSRDYLLDADQASWAGLQAFLAEAL